MVSHGQTSKLHTKNDMYTNCKQNMLVCNCTHKTTCTLHSKKYQSSVQWFAPKIPRMILCNNLKCLKIICISINTHESVKHDANKIHPGEVCDVWTQ